MSAGFWIRVAALLGGLAVAAGAFGAHGLEGKLEPRRMANFQTAVQYQMYHALALLAIGVLMAARPGLGGGFGVAAWSFLIGIVLFSGSLYALALSGVTKLGMITPLGGLAFLIGWAALVWTAPDRPAP